MEKICVFLYGTRVGSCCDGTEFINGENVSDFQGLTIGLLKFRGLKVYQKIIGNRLHPSGKVMELVKREGSLAIVKDERDNERIAVLHETQRDFDGRLFSLGIVATQEERVIPSDGNSKKRWILVN